MDKGNILKELRRNILIESDENKDKIIDNSKLILLGLTHMVNYEQNVNDINVTTLDLFNEDNRFNHLKDGEYFMLPDQREALDFLESNHKNKLLSAQTSFGKTMLIKEFIYRAREKYSKIAIIVPTNALSFEIENDLKNNTKLNDYYDIFDSKTRNTNDNKKEIFVGTQEKFYEIKHENFELIIMDEAYKLNAIDIPENGKIQRRLFILNEILNDYIEVDNTNIILLSPPCEIVDTSENNVESKYRFKVFKTEFNPVTARYKEIKNLDKCLDAVNGEKTIIYNKYPSNLRHLVTHFKEPIPNNIPDEIIQYISDVYTENWNVTKLMRMGILVHNGQIPKFLQEYSIKLFSIRDKNNILAGTDSIAEGINTIAKNVIINMKKGEKNDEVFRSDPMLFKNLSGRAGRMNIYNVGNIFGFMTKEEYEKLFFAEDPKVSIASKNEFDKYKPEPIMQTIDVDESNIDEPIMLESKSGLGVSKKIKDEIIKVIKLNANNSNYLNIIKMYYIVYKGYPNSLLEEFECNLKDVNEKISKTKGVMHSENWNSKYICTKDRITNYLSMNSKNKIEHFMKIRNTFIQFDLKLLCDTAIRIIESENIKPGENIQNILNDFLIRFKTQILGRDMNEELSELEKKVLNRMFEHGVEVDKENLPYDSLNKICSSLNSRFSMYDIRKKICELQFEDDKIKKIRETFFYFD